MGKKFMYVIIGFLSLLLIGLSEFVVAGFDTSILMSPAFWYSVSASSVANMMVLYSSAIQDINLFKTKDEMVIKLQGDIDNAVSKNVENDFDKFLVEENQKRKVYAWKKKIYSKINKLDSKAKATDIELYVNEDEKNKELKSKNKYCYKRAKLERMISDEYVCSNILYLKVKYYKLKKYEITTGCKQKDEEYKLETHPYRRVLIDNLPRMAFSLALVMFFSSFIPDLKDFQVATLITFVIKLLSLCMNFVNGKSYAVYFKDNIMIPDFRYRLDKIISYMTWKVNILSKQTEVNNNG